MPGEPGQFRIADGGVCGRVLSTAKACCERRKAESKSRLIEWAFLLTEPERILNPAALVPSGDEVGSA